MERPLATTRATYKATVKDAGTPGVLILTENKFKFTPNNPTASSAFKLDVDFRTIKGHKFSKEGSKQALLNLTQDGAVKGGGYIFEFENFQDRDTCRDLVAKILGKHHALPPVQGTFSAPEKSGAASATTIHGDRLSQAEMERRMKLLREDSELQKLHKELVISGVLTEAEFWATRKILLDEEASKSAKQRTGMKNDMLSDVRPTTDGRTNLVTFNLSAEIIHQIFAEKPAVHRAFLMNVPHKMSESQFWTKFCRAKHLHRTSNAATAAAEAAEDDDLAIFLKEDDILVSEVRRKIRKVDPTVDMATDYADDYTHLSGYGIIRDGIKESPEMGSNQFKRTLLQDINRHAAVVIEGSTIDSVGDTMTVAEALAKAKQVENAAEKVDEGTEQRRQERVYEMTEIDDLQTPRRLPFSSLCIKDPHQYFDSQHADTIRVLAETGSCGKMNAGEFDLEQACASFGQQIMEINKRGLKDPIMNCDITLKVFNSLTQFISSTKYQLGKNPEKDVLDNLPSNTKEDLLEHWTTVQELLRHFWASYPLTTTFLSNKVNRLKDAMTQIYQKLQEIKESVHSDFRHQVSLLIQPMLQALDAAFAQHEAEAQKKLARNTQ